MLRVHAHGHLQNQLHSHSNHPQAPWQMQAWMQARMQAQHTGASVSPEGGEDVTGSPPPDSVRST